MTRTSDQNSRMWAMLTDISNQVEWVTAQGEPCKPSPENWKDIFTAYLKGQKMFAGIEGGIVMCGERTSRMSTKELSELIEAMYWFGAEKRVIWTNPAEQYNE
jgi:NinB protein